MDESPVLKELELEGASINADDAKQCHQPYRCLRLTRGVSSQPALVGSPTDVSTRLVMQLQRYRAEYSAVLDSNSSLSKETIMRSEWRSELQERRRRAFRNTQEKRRQSPLRLQASAFESRFGLPPGCLRRFDHLAAGLRRANIPNRRSNLASGYGRSLALESWNTRK